MKKNEIVVGGTYSNGKGRIRKVVAEGPEYKLYDSQRTTDYIRYEIIHDGTKKNRRAGQQGNMTRQTFARWAGEKIGEE